MITINNVKFSEAQRFLKEGDILLFRGRSLTSFLIKKSGQTKYSHVGVASSVGENGGKIWECVEFREWKGGRSVNLEVYSKQNPCIIDVYRPVSSIKKITKNNRNIVETDVKFDGKSITNIMRKMTGLPYGWKRIFWMIQYKIPLLKYFYSIDSLIDDYTKDLIYPVCSTAISYAFNRMGYDLLHNRSDSIMEPADIAKSPFLHYIFTICS